MARQTRQKKDAAPLRKNLKPAKNAGAAKAAAPRRPQAARRNGKPEIKTPRAAAAGVGPRPQTAVAQPAPPPRKPGYYEALAMYESGVRALQRHDYQGAATQFRSIIERYPEERELQERSHLYLRVCERETARQPPTPQTPQERVYAATVALNAGDTSTALDHLRRALADSPDSDHAHYIMSVALASRGESRRALEHLRQAITLNPENRALARQDPDLESVRDADEFRELVDAPSGSSRSKGRKKR
jgi:tetratricopeptide (TPR) repeat protein